MGKMQYLDYRSLELLDYFLESFVINGADANFLEASSLGPKGLLGSSVGDPRF